MGFWNKKKKIQPTNELSIKTDGAGNESSVPDIDAIPQEIYGANEVLGGINWYKSQYRFAMKSVLVMAVTLLCSGGLNVMYFLNQPTPKYFASSPDGQITELIPLSRPVMSQAGLLNWVSETVTKTLALDFLHWRDKLTESRANFSPEAFKSFVDAMKSAGVIAMIEEKRLNVSAAVARAPVITASGVAADGKMTWKIEVPIIVSYESSKGIESTQKLLATVLVRRENTVTTPRGVAIAQIVLARDSK